MAKGIYITRFKPDNNGDGGDRRCYQIWQKFNQPEVLSLKDVPNQPLSLVYFLNSFIRLNFRNLSDYLYSKTLQQDQVYRGWNTNFRGIFLTYFRKAKKANKHLQKLITAETTFVIVDDPIYFFPLFSFLKRNNLKIIAIVHNLESLVREQVMPGKEMQMLEVELIKMRQCDELICISREEYWFLKNLGLNAVFLSYQPLGDVKNRMLQINQKRKDSTKKGLLMIGTVNNGPTLKGMLEFKKIFLSDNLATKYGKLIVGGFGMHKYADLFEGENIDVRLKISNEELESLLISCEAFVCYQISGAGALTKIPEIVLAGIPVLANDMAARTYYGLSGISIINSNGYDIK